MLNRRGVSLIEILIGIIIVSIASIATLTYFAYAKGGIGKTGNRRAALERARQRLEQIMSSPLSQLPPLDGQIYWCNNTIPLSGTPEPCSSWVPSGAPVPQTGIKVDDLTGLRMETSIHAIHDPSSGTPITTLDTMELSAKVWFVPGPPFTDDDFNRVHVRTLRTP